MRFKTRVVVVTVLLICCLLISITILYFLIFFDDLKSLPVTSQIKSKPLIIVPFAEIRTKNDTNYKLSYASLMDLKAENKLKSNSFKELLRENTKNSAIIKKVIESLKTDLNVPEDVQQESVWKIAASWMRARQIIPESAPQLGATLNALRQTKIIYADVYKKGTQLKLLLDLEGGQQVLLKPIRYQRNEIITGIYAGADRHNGEIVAFHISRLLNMRFVPIVSSRLIHVTNEIKSVASAALLKTFISINQSIDCFYGECYYCTQYDAVCPDKHGMLEAAIVLLLPKKYELQRLRNPWQRTYKTGIEAQWELDESFCSSVTKKLPLRPRVLDLIDVSIFDYLIGNADRHHYEVFKDVPNSALLFLDNGKSFGDPYHDEMSILAPLYQCCVLRNTTYQRILQLFSINLYEVIDDMLSTDPLYPLLTRDHLLSLNRRLEKIVAIIQICFDSRAKHDVLQ